ncbi:type II secretion system protein GspL [Limnohabitans sp. JirII-29]|uniref:type II secretion system protein GspL n=1 Tax=Limnohabitans sp. JirII-29 TaxID=1835756 RepID=UPI001304DFD2|nr:type II secretion system protein GspL [Limnohabitans sp. JirII-29]
MLIIALPHSHSTAPPDYAYAESDGQSVLRSASSAAAALPLHAGEVVGVVPHSRLSWFSVPLPPGSQGNRLDAVLAGLLEDRLLDDPQQLHLVLPAEARAQARSGGDTWVAVCDKQWFRDSLAPLQAAGLTVQRLVPELSPSETPLLHVLGTPDHASCVLTHAQGVTLLPPNTAQWPAFAALRDPALHIHAEPAMVARAQQLLPQPPVLQSAPQRWLAAASQTRWDLAQGEWTQGGRQRLQRWLQSSWQSVRHAPAWHPVRVGVVSLLVVQWVGLNALAWREQHAMEQQQRTLPNILKTTFPHVTLVVDAPLQMQREVDALKQQTGAASSTDFEPLLAALALVLPSGQTPTQLHFDDHVLRIQGMSLTDEESRLANNTLHAQGLRLRQEGNDNWLLQAEGTP